MVDGIGGVNGTSGVNYAGALTPDALMLFCSTRLGDLDSKMYGMFDKQERQRNESVSMQKLQQKLSELGSGHAGYDLVLDGGDKAEAADNDMLNAFDATLFSLEKNSPEWNAVNSAKQKWIGTMRGQDMKINSQECLDLAKDVGDAIKGLNDSSQMDMIQLQSIMSQRQTAIQLTTNLVAALGETSKAIVGKIGT